MLGRDSNCSAADDDAAPAAQRVRAIEVLVELFGGLDPRQLAERCTAANDPAVRARVAWALGRGP